MPTINTTNPVWTHEGRFLPYHVKMEGRLVKECAALDVRRACQRCVYRSDIKKDKNAEKIALLKQSMKETQRRIEKLEG